MELEVRLDAPRREIHLHAVGLEVSRARARVQDRSLKATLSADAESETLTLHFDEELPRGNAILDLAWSGKFSPGLRGLYRAGPLAVTQFEAADARRVFPCFDEPAFKARWNLQLVGLSDTVTALSNGQIVKDQKEPDGGRTVQFSETPPLSSYLIAVCFGALDARGLFRSAVRVRQGRPDRRAGLRGGRDGERSLHHVPRSCAAARSEDGAAERPEARDRKSVV